ncbi:hypothetical protein GF367_01910 [Candidatus Woesearchaeota archaeon]|nr:hypothetical protein [Candidatus Woesearchaeota archaeon]
MKNILLGGENGKLYKYSHESDKLTQVFRAGIGQTVMGLAGDSHHLYVGGSSAIFKLDRKSYTLISTSEQHSTRNILGKRRKPDFHHMALHHGHLLVSGTYDNHIYLFDKEPKLQKKVKIQPPNKYLPTIYKKNYNHLNSIWPHKGKYYICLNWLNKQYGPSGVAVLDKHLNEIERYEKGWEAHKYCIIDGKEMELCGSSGTIKRVNHPHQAGLLVDDTFLFEHYPDKYFCKDYSIDKKHIYIVGGSVEKRENRRRTKGVLFVVDKESNEEVKRKEFSGTGGFRGCLLEGKDYTQPLQD